ncbi:hypothetical protein K491DRAFT_475301 [Lophiostoma macrostomum CBS 122681]|uniref:Uncharacterized protein n=1 Tax=Lophiostoma macrostomum CBS 122681 TaxID=1314788 RepID=A0A6A6T6X3_9PLEO|nr:hypothetical protein K491DRAFT_475301 [Lophiostoma macrostomum CBS 122681]
MVKHSKAGSHEVKSAYQGFEPPEDLAQSIGKAVRDQICLDITLLLIRYQRKRGRRGGGSRYTKIEEPLAQMKSDTKGYRVDKNIALRPGGFKTEETVHEAQEKEAGEDIKEVVDSRVDLSPLEPFLKKSRILQGLITPMLGVQFVEGWVLELKLGDYDLLECRKLSMGVPGMEIAQLASEGLGNFDKEFKRLDLNRTRS